MVIVVIFRRLLRPRFLSQKDRLQSLRVKPVEPIDKRTV
jgi:hypothetical protein